MNGKTEALEARARYVNAYNDTMISIWKEKIQMLGVVDTGALYRSVTKLYTRADDKYTSIELAQSFLEYGIYVDRGTGSNTWKGNPGDIGTDNPRKRYKWFSRKHYASVMKLQEFFAENLGADMAQTVSSYLMDAR